MFKHQKTVKKISAVALSATILAGGLLPIASFAQETRTSTTTVNTTNSNSVNDLSGKTLDDLWSEKDFKIARIAISHIESFKDENGNLLLKLVDSEGLDQTLTKMNSPMNASALKDAIDNFNKIIVEEKGNGELTKFNESIASQYKAIDSADMNPKITCSDALGAIGLIHAGSYTAAALLLSISGGLSAGIPFIISTAYYLGSLLC